MAEIIHSAADANANIIFGSVIDENMQDEIRVTLIATGFEMGRGASGGGGWRSSSDRHGPRRASAAAATPAAGPPDRGPRVSDRDRSSLEISDDDIDIPPFLR